MAMRKCRDIVAAYGMIGTRQRCLPISPRFPFNRFTDLAEVEIEDTHRLNVGESSSPDVGPCVRFQRSIFTRSSLPCRCWSARKTDIPNEKTTFAAPPPPTTTPLDREQNVFFLNAENVSLVNHMLLK